MPLGRDELGSVGAAVEATDSPSNVKASYDRLHYELAASAEAHAQLGRCVPIISPLTQSLA